MTKNYSSFTYSYFWNRPLGAAESVRRLTVVLTDHDRQRLRRRPTTTRCCCWAVPMTLAQCQLEIRNNFCHNRNKNSGVGRIPIETLEIVGTGVAPWDLWTGSDQRQRHQWDHHEEQWKGLCQAIAQSSLPRSLRTIRFVAECCDWERSVLLSHHLAWNTPSQPPTSTTGIPLSEIDIQGGCGPWKREEDEKEEDTGQQTDNYALTFQVLSDWLLRWQKHRSSCRRIPFLKLTVAYGATLSTLDMDRLMYGLVMSTTPTTSRTSTPATIASTHFVGLKHLNLMGPRFASPQDYRQFLCLATRPEALDTAITVLEVGISNSTTGCLSTDSSMAWTSSMEQPCLEFVHWNAALQSMRQSNMSRWKTRQREKIVHQSDKDVHHQSLLVMDAAVIVLRDWYRSSILLPVQKLSPEEYLQETTPYLPVTLSNSSMHQSVVATTVSTNNDRDNSSVAILTLPFDSDTRQSSNLPKNYAGL